MLSELFQYWLSVNKNIFQFPLSAISYQVRSVKGIISDITPL